MSGVIDEVADVKRKIFFRCLRYKFWNLFNAKYYKTDRSLILDLLQPKKMKESFSAGFFWISLVIVLGQIIIVTFAGKMFNVQCLQYATG